MENTVNLIKKFFDKGGWKYNYKEVSDGRAIFTAGVNMNNALGNLRICIIVRQDYYTVYAIFNNHAEKKYYSQVAEYLHRANYGMKNGNFEFDFEDGEVRFKTYVNFEGIQLSDDIIEESILVPVFMFDTYGKNLLRIMLGDDNPKKLIEEAEKEPEGPDEGQP